MNENFNDFFIWKIQAIRNELREMQSAIQCNLRVRFWLTNLTWCLYPALPLKTPFSLFPQKHVPLTHFLPT